MRFAYPVMLDVADRLVVIIGGGAVAVRKAKALLESGATRVRIVAPSISDEMPSSVERVIGPYDPRHIDGSALVVAATDLPGVNERVVVDARARRILVNRADDGGGGDFVTPALWRQGQLVLAVSCGSAALSAVVRDDLAAKLDQRHARMSQVMEELRPLIRSHVADPHRRATIFHDLAGDAALEVLVRQGDRGLKAWLTERYPELNFQ